MTLKGVKFTEEHKQKISNSLKGRKLSPEHIKNCVLGHKGLKHTEDWKKENGERCKGIKNWQWKGDNGSYGAIHNWVRKWKGRPNHCEVCGTTERRMYHWANIDHKYRRVLEDYISMCEPCHVRYDIDLKLR